MPRHVLLCSLLHTGLLPFQSTVGDIPVETGSSHPTTTFTLQEAGGKVICSTYLDSSHASCSAGCGDSIDIGETQKIAMSLSSDCSLSSYTNNTEFIFELDFSGHSTAGGAFGKQVSITSKLY